MEENKETQNTQELPDNARFDIVVSGADIKLIIGGLLELPAKFSRDLINRLELVMMTQLKPKDDKNDNS